MKLEAVNIKRLRSIEQAELDNCGGFNVLIGKNNAGKSNVLSAIKFFFDCLKTSNIVTLAPPIGKPIDFFEQNVNTPIEIGVTFTLSAGEKESLLTDIVSEAPRMKNAVEGLTLPFNLYTSITFISSPVPFAYVNRVALATKSPFDDEHIILDVSVASAEEMYYRLSQLTNKEKEIEALTGLVTRMKGDEWARIREAIAEKGMSAYYLQRLLSQNSERGLYEDEASSSVGLSAEFRQTVINLVRESNSSDELRTAAQSLAEEKKVEATTLEKEPLSNTVNTFSGAEASVPNYVLQLLASMSQIEVLHLTENRKPIGRDEAQRILSLKVKRGGDADLQNIQQTVQELLGVRIDAFQADAPARTEMPAELDVDNFIVQANGSGIREALRLVFDYEFKRPQILLVEEPETHLHPALESNMMRYLKRISSDCQVFITTHSTNFLDTSEMKNVYLVSKPYSSEVQWLSLEDAETQLPKELGLRLSSLFMFDRLVFVEGASDEAILRAWAYTLNINLSQPNVGFVHMEGVRNFAHYATEATLSFLSKRRVKMTFLMDRDEKEDPEIKKLEEVLGDKADLCVLQKRELENYLICPTALVKFIAFKANQGGIGKYSPALTETEVDAKIAEVAETLKQATIDKRVVKALCQPIYPARDALFSIATDTTIAERIEAELTRMIAELEAVKGRVAEVCQTQDEVVNHGWASNCRAVIQGDILLDEVCKTYGVRFNKVKDGSRLASMMEASGIDSEINTIIRRIAS